MILSRQRARSIVHVPLRPLCLCGVILLSLWSVVAQAVGQTDSAAEAKKLEAERYFNQAQELVGTADENSERQIGLLEKPWSCSRI